jgi:hypothetical protein
MSAAIRIDPRRSQRDRSSITARSRLDRGSIAPRRLNQMPSRPNDVGEPS